MDTTMASVVYCTAVNVGSCARATLEGAEVERIKLRENGRNSRVLIVGGAGAVGRNTAAALSKICPDLNIIIGARNRNKGAKVVESLGGNSMFAQVDAEDIASLEAAMADVDLVVHAAGPFEYAKCNVLEAAIQTKTAYIDVSDSKRYARRAREYKRRAMASGVPAITNCGIGPGTVMAAMLVRAAENQGRGRPESLNFYYFTAGSGGAGLAILASSFYLFGDKVVIYEKGARKKLKPYTNKRLVDFGEGIGNKEVFLLNLSEVESTHEVFGVPNISSRFGTSPFFWNWIVSAIINLVPAEFLRDEKIVRLLVPLSYPSICAMDAIFGETFSIKVELKFSDGYETTGIYTHKRLSEATGAATAAFAAAVLEGSTKPGVWFPEEVEGITAEAREILLIRAALGATNFVVNNQSFVSREQRTQIKARNKWDRLVHKCEKL